MKSSEISYENMLAPCGVNCNFCYKHVKKIKRCAGCLNSDLNKTNHCINCKIKHCAIQKGCTHCFYCEFFPCKLIKNLEKSYIKRYKISLIENGINAKKLGIYEFLKNDSINWICANCGGAISMHDGVCSECGRQTMNFINGGVTAAKGFKANGIHCGIRKNKTKPDLALIYSDVLCTAAAVYTQNLVKGAPVIVTQNNLRNGTAQAVIANSGNANTCNADGIEKAEKMCKIVADNLGILQNDVIVASTGVIGQVLPIEPIENAAKELADGLDENGSNLAATAIMTTDTFAKEAAVSVEIGGKNVTIGGITKGSGMIHPNMATMLGFSTTDCAISAEMLDKAVRIATEKTFNMISVDGDTSTNDTYAIMANSLAGNAEITEENEDFETFTVALTAVSKKLAMMMAKDGEGATKLIIADVCGAKDEITAKTVAKGIICSSLFKSAMFGEDANWGRVLCAIGYSGADVDVNKIELSFKSSKGTIKVCENGAGIDFSEEVAAEVLSSDEITVCVDLHDGEENAEAYGCDLTYDYVKINGDYRT